MKYIKLFENYQSEGISIESMNYCRDVFIDLCDDGFVVEDTMTVSPLAWVMSIRKGRETIDGLINRPVEFNCMLIKDELLHVISYLDSQKIYLSSAKIIKRGRPEDAFTSNEVIKNNYLFSGDLEKIKNELLNHLDQDAIVCYFSFNLI